MKQVKRKNVRQKLLLVVSLVVDTRKTPFRNEMSEISIDTIF